MAGMVQVCLSGMEGDNRCREEVQGGEIEESEEVNSSSVDKCIHDNVDKCIRDNELSDVTSSRFYVQDRCLTMRPR